MGLYDHVKCEMPLPSEPKPPATNLFQSKDTPSQYLGNYTITSDGRLIQHTYRAEQVPEPEQFRDVVGVGGSGAVRRMPAGDVEVPFHGDMELCEFDESHEWWRYIARFTAGRCVRIWCEEHRRHEPKP